MCEELDDGGLPEHLVAEHSRAPSLPDSDVLDTPAGGDTNAALDTPKEPRLSSPEDRTLDAPDDRTLDFSEDTSPAHKSCDCPACDPADDSFDASDEDCFGVSDDSCIGASDNGCFGASEEDSLDAALFLGVINVRTRQSGNVASDDSSGQKDSSQGLNGSHNRRSVSLQNAVHPHYTAEDAEHCPSSDIVERSPSPAAYQTYRSPALDLPYLRRWTRSSSAPR
ncbi:hypothetical protein BD626DRAFT_574873 [Schizophyllum amplum]|uniref:Uncharacterized protein n=1 Tax=Schizophyllum amplum TaxID=97359 RepID=A0A550BWX7_9AGAR|nr:hypothetical protein BD626DRAFT_574873 [Auriculariopsis ampla]